MIHTDTKRTGLEIDPSDEVLRARLALDAGRLGSWIWDVKEDVINGDTLTAQLFDLAPDAKTWPRAAVFKNVHHDDIPYIQATLAKVLESEDIYEVEFRKFADDTHTDDDTIIWIRNRARVTHRDETGRATRLIGICWDVTAEKQHEDIIKQIAGDMDHRAKNAFAVIRAMINLGQKRASDLDSFADTLRGQIEAIASAHTLAASISRTQEISQAPVPVLELVRASLKSWKISLENSEDRIHVTGDETAKISSEAANSMSMMIHELAASSSRHGAFGPAGGNVTVDVKTANQAEISLSWTEDFDTPLSQDAQNTNEGFGSTLLSYAVATLRGEVSRELKRDGLNFELRLPHLSSN